MKRLDLDGEEGFSLVEVLVAFTILAAAVIAGFQIFGDGLRRIGRAGSYLNLVEDARASLDTLSAIEPGQYAIVSARGRDLRIVVSAVAGDPEPWPLVRPYRVRVWNGADPDAPPLLDTIVMGPAAR
jgi:type II secretory pathway pseudopilin PulG